MNEALRDWVTNVSDTFYCIGTGCRPAPLSDDGARLSVRDRQRDARADDEGGRPPAEFASIACIGGGSNAMGLFSSVSRRQERRDLPASKRQATASTRLHDASIAGGRPGVLHGNRTYLLDGRRRPNSGSAFDLGGSRLSRHRAGAFVAQRHRPREISFGDRRGSARGVPVVQPPRRHHPGARAGARAGQGDGPRAKTAEGSSDGAQYVRPRRQGSRQRRRASSEASCDLRVSKSASPR